MAPSIEAHSLASLCQLAANPPVYPVNPTEGQQEPLTLYISRVPGTRDVILSPLKPLLKNVTAGDVANCLYYIHYNEVHPLDIEPPITLKDPESPRSSFDSGGSDRVHRIPRKSVPTHVSHLSTSPTPSSSLTTGERQYDRPRPGSPHEQGRERPADPPAQYQQRQSGLVSPPPSGAIAQTGGLSNRPLGPRPLPPLPIEGPRTLNSNTEVPSYARTPPTVRPVLQQMSSRTPSPLKRHEHTPSAPFSLTLIRRDPSSGAQWNVGLISSLQEPELLNGTGRGAHHLSGMDTKTNVAPSITVRIQTPGYSKFKGLPGMPFGDASKRGSTSSLPLARSPGITEEEAMATCFTRRVVMSYRKDWSLNLKRNASPPPQTHGARHLGHRCGHSRGDSGFSASSFDSDSPEEFHDNDQGTGHPKGYTFTSPWGGHCQFRTGNWGRSVKCRHVLDGGDTPANPLAPKDKNRGHSRGSGVSELRFNLPNSDILRHSTEDSPQRKRGSFSGLFHFQHPGHSEDGEESPVALGRERAGGGNRGKRAKLGKLIIKNDGLKMLDLIVAANMGIWWGAWERSF